MPDVQFVENEPPVTATAPVSVNVATAPPAADDRTAELEALHAENAAIMDELQALKGRKGFSHADLLKALADADEIDDDDLTDEQETVIVPPGGATAPKKKAEAPKEPPKPDAKPTAAVAAEDDDERHAGAWW